MERQMAVVQAVIKPLPYNTPPPGIDPSYWKFLVPQDNIANDARIALGRKLYFDTRLSKDNTVSCATCHDVSRGFADRRGTSEGIGDKLGQRNAPTTMNSLFFSTQFWDGRAATLEEQAKLPIVNPIEMGMPNGQAAVDAIKNDNDYRVMFQAAYNRAPSYDDIGRAIAAFERTLVFLDAPFDDFQGGNAKALGEDAKAGWILYNGKARCNSCHQISSGSPIGTDNRFHNVGVSAKHQDFEALAKKALAALAKDNSKEAQDRFALETDLSELGRFVVTKNRNDIGSFKTPQVRNVGITAPYMHDGSMATLWDVVDHYNKGGEPNAFLDGGIEPLALTDTEVDQLVAFLFALTDVRFADANKAELDRQKKIAAQRRPNKDEAAAMRKVFPFEKRLQAPTSPPAPAAAGTGPATDAGTTTTEQKR
ncbi:MAG: cytochrome-c peroxidase [Labilithrix sp.]|nr:cytochrome-c peroxidase [Labilithrix sp.]MCW5816760.1 cytochrome-c peroxidase [Labilithrix sp.]